MNNWKKSICSKRSGQSSEETPCFQGSGDLLLVIVASCVTWAGPTGIALLTIVVLTAELMTAMRVCVRRETT